ncbi:hypothetical protein HYH02_006875 [Chlamydomonas schloesseri]|uniref:Pherophorin domain-containing protein n=1 Tax=Chlamydomonas schloesseri TaxID=2026947 RepID=A0A835WJL4_9CHLO|nr:hypothetical protein HYH02_006875 [Chlamydomonas schloesseri]|eukprot:KAG2448291.1 hypothetical protein HYH02_006875 [Chlamydomonas schloesseri]
MDALLEALSSNAWVCATNDTEGACPGRVNLTAGAIASLSPAAYPDGLFVVVPEPAMLQFSTTMAPCALGPDAALNSRCSCIGDGNETIPNALPIRLEPFAAAELPLSLCYSIPNLGTPATPSSYVQLEAVVNVAWDFDVLPGWFATGGGFTVALERYTFPDGALAPPGYYNTTFLHSGDVSMSVTVYDVVGGNATFSNDGVAVVSQPLTAISAAVAVTYSAVDAAQGAAVIIALLPSPAPPSPAPPSPVPPSPVPPSPSPPSPVPPSPSPPSPVPPSPSLPSPPVYGAHAVDDALAPPPMADGHDALLAASPPAGGDFTEPPVYGGGAWGPPPVDVAGPPPEDGAAAPPPGTDGPINSLSTPPPMMADEPVGLASPPRPRRILSPRPPHHSPPPSPVAQASPSPSPSTVAPSTSPSPSPNGGLLTSPSPSPASPAPSPSDASVPTLASSPPPPAPQSGNSQVGEVPLAAAPPPMPPAGGSASQHGALGRAQAMLYTTLIGAACLALMLW